MSESLAFFSKHCVPPFLSPLMLENFFKNGILPWSQIWISFCTLMRWLQILTKAQWPNGCYQHEIICQQPVCFDFWGMTASVLRTAGHHNSFRIVQAQLTQEDFLLVYLVFCITILAGKGFNRKSHLLKRKWKMPRAINNPLREGTHSFHSFFFFHSFFKSVSVIGHRGPALLLLNGHVMLCIIKSGLWSL